MIWQNSQQLSLALENCFKQIQQQRIQDLNIINPYLTVQAIDFQLFNDYWLGILITPWFMNLIYIDGAVLPIGSKAEHLFPAGQFSFTIGYEKELGYFQTCSLFSPMFEFQNQSVAVEAATAALHGLLMQKTINRRALLTAQFKT
jgi:[NiFe] hydrogenase assembly HybE family chaperone